MSIQINKIITVTGEKVLSFQQRYPVTLDSVIELRAEFRSIGNIKSKLFFGLDCFKENGTTITSGEIFRTNESLLIISKNSDMMGFTLEKKPETWCNSTDTYSESYRKKIGFYFDGNINRLPDYLINSPAYKTYEDKNIFVNKAIPKEIYDKIICFKTKVMSHYDNSTYDYSAADNVEVDKQWSKFEATYNGFSNGYGDIKGKFRLETKTISPIIIANYQQDSNAVLEIKNIEIIIKDKPQLIEI